MNLGTGSRTGFHTDGTVDVACWCEAEIVAVSVPRFERRLTESCGRPTCEPPRVER